VRALLDEGTAWSRSRYQGTSNHQMPVESLGADGVRLCVARGDDWLVLGAGAVVLHPGWAEIKRLFVTEAARGRGVGRTLLSELEAIARDSGATIVRLETGIYSDAAIRLYGAAGFAPCGRFGAHEDDPLSVFMEKRLDA
jgi:putative acetyltransferase